MTEIKIDKLPTVTAQVIIQKIRDKIKPESISNKNILIVCEDNTRSTPVHLFFKQLYSLFSTKNHIKILFATGTHRPMTMDEIATKLGLDTKETSEYEITCHNAFDDSQLNYICDLNNIPLKINKLISSSNIVITIGGVLPHRVVGFSGGGKILCPGIGNKEMIDYSHWMSTNYKETDIMAKIENPVRSFINDISTSITKHYPQTTFFSLNFISVPEGIVHLSIGDFVDSYTEAAKISYQTFIKKVKKCNNILAIVDDKCTDFWQAAKAVYNCARVINNGGLIVIKGKLTDGISKTHYNDIKKIGYSDPATIKKQFETGKITNQVAASHMIRVSEYLEKIRIALSSDNLSPEICNSVNLEYIDPKDIVPNNFDYVVYNPVDIVLESETN